MPLEPWHLALEREVQARLSRSAGISTSALASGVRLAMERPSRAAVVRSRRNFIVMDRLVVWLVILACQCSFRKGIACSYCLYCLSIRLESLLEESSRRRASKGLYSDRFFNGSNLRSNSTIDPITSSTS